jgi:hypothetical protein
MIAAGNKYFYNVRQIFTSRAMSKAVTIKIYTTMVKIFVEFWGGMWAMTEMVMRRLGTWERKMLRNIHGPVVERGIWRKRRTNQELRELYKNLDIVADFKTEENGMDWTCNKDGSGKDS